MLGCNKAGMDVVDASTQYQVMLSGECATKTSFAPEENNERPVLWKAGDMLGLFVQEGDAALEGAQNVLARLYDGAYDGPGFSKGSFTTYMTLSASKVYTLGIYYPYIAGAGTADAITHKVASVQTQAASSDSRHLGAAGAFAYTTAKFSTPSDMQYYESPVVNFTLSHKTSTILLSLKAASADLDGWKVKSVKLTAPEGVNIAGDVKYVPSSDEFTLTGNGSESIVLNISGGAALSVDTPVELYMVAFPTALAGKELTITYTLESASAIKTLTHTRAVKAESKALKAATVHQFDEVIPAADAEGWTSSAADAAFDLSANGTANCYMVSTPGKYSFDATVIGNGQKGILTPIAKTFFHTDNAAIVPASAELLWQTTPGLITSLKLEGGKVIFEKSATDGNALVAVKDSEGTILWSWHLWCTDMGALHTFVSPTGAYDMMDRNLGATYASSGLVTDPVLVQKSYGCFYQWGRKDPFMGPAEADYTSAQYTAALVTLYDIDGKTVSRPANTSGRRTSGAASNNEIAQWSSVQFLIERPMAYVETNSNTSQDWFSSGKELKGTGPEYRAYSLWGNPEGYNYNTASKPTPVKTIYDPCPPGFMVPPVDALTGFTVPSSGDYGHLVSGDGVSKTWVPFSSHFSYEGSNTGKWRGQKMAYLRTSGYGKANSSTVHTLRFQQSGAHDIVAYNTAYGFNLRCIAEIH